MYTYLIGTFEREGYHVYTRGSPRGFRELGNIGKISKGTGEHEPIFREQGNKTFQVRGPKHC